MKKKDKIIVIVMGIISVLLFTTSFFFINFFEERAKSQDYDYETVTCTVVDRYERYGTRSTRKIFVKYKGEKYELENPDDLYKYYIGQSIEAYLYNGKLYADADKIYFDSKDGKIMGAFVIIRFSSGIMAVVGVPAYIMATLRNTKKKKNTKPKNEPFYS